MSKTLPTKHTFDAERFARLLSEAKGDRSQTQFASECGLSVSHMNGYFHARRSQPPIPSTIQKIALNAQNGITFEELIDAAGYDLEQVKMRQLTYDRFNMYNNITLDKYCYSQIVICISHCDFRWVEIPDRSPDGKTNVTGMGFSLKIGIEDEPFLQQWLFMIKHFTESNRGVTELKNFYGDVATASFEPHAKISIVVCSEEEYELVKRFNPINLNIYVSVIRFDMELGQIVKEEYLRTALEVPDYFNNKFSLQDKN